jgi:hypothetical protein
MVVVSIKCLETREALRKGGKAMTNENVQRKKGWETSGVFVPACLLIGMGVGWLLGHLVAGLFIGLGVGLLLMAVVQAATGK